MAAAVTNRMTVLISSASAKVLLVRSFQEAGARVVAIDSDPASPALYQADTAFVVPPLRHPDFAQLLERLCRKERVDLLVPTRDGELMFYANRAEALHAIGTTVLVSGPGELAVCLDKRRFIDTCQRLGFPVPHTWPASACPDRWPVFVRSAAESTDHARRVDDPAELAALQRRQPTDLIVQEYVRATEYSIDVLCDFAGVPLQGVVRRRSRVRGGEAVVSIVEHRPPLEALVMQLCAHLKLVGHVVAQAFDDDQTGPRFIEMNPRFGGASNLSIAAGLDSPARLLALLAGDASARALRPIRTGLQMLRYAQDILVDSDAASFPRVNAETRARFPDRVAPSDRVAP